MKERSPDWAAGWEAAMKFHAKSIELREKWIIWASTQPDFIAAQREAKHKMDAELAEFKETL